MNEAVIVAGLRTAVGKAPKGSLRTTRPDDLAAEVIRALLAQNPQIAPDQIDDVILGCATPEGESGANVARIAALRAGLPDSVPAVTVNRFCSSGSQTIAQAAERIMAGMAEIIIAGGTESMSLVRGSNRFRPNPYARGGTAAGVPEHGPDGGERRAQVQRVARGRRRVRAAQPSARARGAGRREVRGRRDRADRGRDRRGRTTASGTRSTRTKARARIRRPRRWRS